MTERNQRNHSKTRPEQAEKLSSRERTRGEDLRDDSTLEQVELLAAGAEENDDIDGDGLGEKLAELAVTSDEEVDALKINLLQEDERPDSEGGSGLIVDDEAEERIARFTEADPREANLGAISVDPGLDNTSNLLRRHDRKEERAHSDAVIEDNLDEPMDETIVNPEHR